MMKLKKKTYQIITIGCQMNKSDSERIAGYLEYLDFIRVEDGEKAGLVIITTCGVRQSAEDRIYGLVPKIKRQNPGCMLVITGCLSEREDVINRLQKFVDMWMPIAKLTSLDKYLKQNFQFSISNFQKFRKIKNYLSIKPKYESAFTAYVPIGNGCNNFCAYCVVPFARGREIYRPAGEIINEVKGLVKNGYREIILIAQNVNSYESRNVDRITHNFNRTTRNAQRITWDGNTINFSGLLRAIDDIPGDFWVCFLTSHPKDMSDELIGTIKQCSKICEYIHLPVQAGDNKVLKRMNRGYTIGHYKKLIRKIRKTIPGVSISTDLIVGFPGETKAQFMNSKKLFEEIGFDMAYLARYSPRPYTQAAKMDDNISKQEKARREKEVQAILERTALKNNKKYIGQVIRALAIGRNKKGALIAKSRTQKMVMIAGSSTKKISPGNFAWIKITGAKEFALEGKITNPGD